MAEPGNRAQKRRMAGDRVLVRGCGFKSHLERYGTGYGIAMCASCIYKDKDVNRKIEGLKKLSTTLLKLQ